MVKLGKRTGYSLEDRTQVDLGDVAMHNVDGIEDVLRVSLALSDQIDSTTREVVEICRLVANFAQGLETMAC